MRRSARVLSVVVLAGAALGGAVPLAAADPAAEVSPSAVQAGGTVTVAVVCDPITGAAPEVIDATSKAFAEGTVKLRLVFGKEDPATGPAYRGTAVIAAAGQDSAWTVDGTCPGAAGAKGKAWSATLTAAPVASSGTTTCVEPKQWCGGPVVEHGVHAGSGGAFGVSVPALVAGGLLIAGALGAAGYRLWRRDTPGDA
ncbi:hypothetical protein I2W78_04935 [Streptomyces spinoverrucosus]|uniref:hypothetical protein n=1 Tax=Streptomyces spinoverrucosus TaxID=284043 RepID=UPI0018C3A3F8|nr:hypothetical protein [Streptomyces spinoverrucosus]MBG0851215.1 hypothetical protein [Streptomyces spinoverrucosus]